MNAIYNATSTQVLALILTKGMFYEHRREEMRPYGLYSSQMREDRIKISHNGGWYNKKGEKLGWGDISIHDILRISLMLPEGELFYILPERASFWNAARDGLRDTQTPGIEYVQLHCCYVVTPGRILKVDDYGTPGEKAWHNIAYMHIYREKLAETLSTLR